MVLNADKIRSGVRVVQPVCPPVSWRYPASLGGACCPRAPRASPRQSQSACTPVWHLVHFFRACCAAPCPHPRALHTQGRHHLNNAIFWPWGRLVALARRAQLDASGTPRRHVPEQTRNARRGALARLASARECSRVLVNADARRRARRAFTFSRAVSPGHSSLDIRPPDRVRDGACVVHAKPGLRAAASSRGPLWL